MMPCLVPPYSCKGALLRSQFRKNRKLVEGRDLRLRPSSGWHQDRDPPRMLSWSRRGKPTGLTTRVGPSQACCSPLHRPRIQSRHKNASMQTPKVCTKLALVGRAKRKGVLATLYLKLALPLSESPLTYTLFPNEEGVTLQRWYVHGLNANQEAPALDTSAATAASALKISISADDEPSEKCHITKDANINLAAPPLAALSASQPSRKISRIDKRWFMVTLHLHIPYKLQPPRDPHLVGPP